MKKTGWGQNFLTNRNAAEKMIGQFFPVRGPVLEIGPGKGILTGLLIQHRRDNRIIAVELDTTLVSQLRETYAGIDGFEVVNRDILKTDPCRLFPGEGQTVNVIGNVPYYISKEIVDWLIRHYGKVGRGMLTMQKEFVDKLTSGTGSKAYNAQSVLFNGLFRVKKAFDVRPGSFSPPPKVTSTVFLWEQKAPLFDDEADTADFYRFLRRCFAKRRKTLLNNLAAVVDTGKLLEILKNQSLDSRVRAEQLGPEDFLKIYRALNNCG